MTIIEVSRRYDPNRNIKGNYTWENTIGIPQTLNNGDVMNLKLAIIDAENVGYNNIVLPTDITCNITVGFWATNLPPPLLKYDSTDSGVPAPGFDFFNYSILRTPSTASPANENITTNRTFQIPAGTYEPSQLAEYITRILNDLHINKSLNTKQITVDLLENYNKFFLRTQNKFYIIYDGLPHPTDLSGLLVLKSQQPNIPDTWAVGDTGITMYYGTGKGIEYITDCEIGLITSYPADPTYWYISVNKNMPNVSRFSIALVRKTPDSPDWVFQPPYDVGNDTRISNDEDIWVGAQNFNLQYNVNGDGRYRFTMHTPPYDPKSGNLCNIVYIGKEPYIRVIPALSGCFFTQLDPPDFWNNTLGFDTSNMIVNFDQINNLIGELKPGVNISSNYVDYNSLCLDELLPLIPESNASTSAMATLYQDTGGLMQSIIATKDLNQGGSKFYYIYADMGLNMECYYYGGKRGQLVGVLNKQVDNTGAIYGVGDTSFIYQHRGESVVISSVNLTILDENQEPAIIGDNNTVFFEITRA